HMLMLVICSYWLVTIARIEKNEDNTVANIANTIFSSYLILEDLYFSSRENELETLFDCCFLGCLIMHSIQIFSLALICVFSFLFFCADRELRVFISKTRFHF